MRRRRLLQGLVAGGVSAVAGCTRLPGVTEDYDIGMSANAFQPTELTISVGDTVVWYNDGSRAHTVTAYERGIPAEASFFATGGYDSESVARDEWAEREGGNLSTGEQFTHTFEVPGRHAYFCVPHESHGMLGDIIVEE